MLQDPTFIFPCQTGVLNVLPLSKQITSKNLTVHTQKQKQFFGVSSKLTIKTLKHISHFFQVFILLTFSK